MVDFVTTALCLANIVKALLSIALRVLIQTFS